MKIATFCLVLLAGLPSGAEERVTETAHMRWVWSDDSMGDEAQEFIHALGEEIYQKVVGLLDVGRADKTVVLLHGPSEQPDGRRGIPHVDSSGRVHLYRFGPTHHDYLSAFAHELVHSFRIDRMPHHDWFFEEGFAEFIALRARAENRGFPWYGFSVDVVAGQWVATDTDLPLALLRERHQELNQRCKLQVYALRGSFFDDLGQRFGDAAILKLAAREQAGALADYQAILDESFDSLAGSWRERLLARYVAIADAPAQAARYRRESPAKYQFVCASDGTVKR